MGFGGVTIISNKLLIISLTLLTQCPALGTLGMDSASASVVIFFLCFVYQHSVMMSQQMQTITVMGTMTTHKRSRTPIVHELDP